MTSEICECRHEEHWHQLVKPKVCLKCSCEKFTPQKIYLDEKNKAVGFGIKKDDESLSDKILDSLFESNGTGSGGNEVNKIIREVVKKLKDDWISIKGRVGCQRTNDLTDETHITYYSHGKFLRWKDVKRVLDYFDKEIDSIFGEKLI